MATDNHPRRTEILAANLALQQEATSKMSKSAKRRKNKARGKAKATKNETPNHYVAYVPLAGDLWKLDGMDMHPRNLGPIGDGEAWINTVRDDIEKRMAVFANDESAGYTVLGIVEDKLPALIDMLGRNVNHLNWVEFCISEKRDYWNRSIATEPEENTWAIGHEPIRAPDIRFDLTQKILDSKGVCFTYAQKKDISTCSEEHLNWIRPDIVEEQLHLRELILPLKEEREAQWAKYKDRMFDYGPVIHQWLKFLHENGNLAPLIDAHLKAQKEDQN